MKKLAYICLLLLACSSQAQNFNFQFQRLGEDKGWSKPIIYDIYQDKDGFIWSATTNGLVKFDGYKTKLYYHDPENEASLNSNYLRGVDYYSENELWISTANGACILNTETDEITRLSNEPEHPLSITHLTEYLKDSQGRHWVLGSRGIALYNPEDTSIKYLPLVNYEHEVVEHNVRCIMEDSKGDIWIGSGGSGVYRFEQDKFKVYYSANPEKTFTNGQAFALHEDENGIIWCGSFIGGLSYFNTQLDSFIFYRNPFYEENSFSGGVIALNSFDSKNLIVGLNGGGIVFFNTEKKIFHSLHTSDKNNKYSLPDNFFPSIFNDNAGRFWLGTENGGMAILDPNLQKFQKFPLNTSGKLNNISTCNAIFIDSEKNFWFGGEDGWLEVYSKDLSLKNHYEVKNLRFPGQGLFIKDIIETQEGKILIATSIGGLYVLDGPEDNTPELVDGVDELWSRNDMFSCTKDSRGSIWIGSHAGLLKYKDGMLTNVYHLDTTKGLVEYINDVERINDKIYTGFSSKGFGIMDIGTEEYTAHYTKDNSDLLDNYVLDLYYDNEHFLWIATQNGLQKFDLNNEEFTTYTIKDGLPSSSILSINKSGKFLWLGTANGLARFDYDTEEIHTYGIPDGVSDLQFRINASFKTKTGILFFATNNGITYFDPNEIKEDTNVGNLVFTSFYYNDSLYSHQPGGILTRPINKTDTIELNYDHPLISFEFALLNYTSPENSSYAYRLYEMDSTWYHIGARRYVDFTRLPHGTYTFQVKAANHDGVWMENPRQIIIIVHPPFWKTTWFLILSISLVLVLFWTILQLRTRNIQAKRKELEKEVENRTVEIRSKNIILEEKSEEIMQSINYARRLQDAILPSHEMIKALLPKYSLLYMPKDIVAGDFYWMEENKTDNLVCFAVADCTGHGVPGAMVSVVCSTALSRSVKEFGLKNSKDILDKTRELVVETFEKSVVNVKDGMDISLFVLDKANHSITWTGAHNPLWIIRKGENTIDEIAADKQPVAYFDHAEKFTETALTFNPGDKIYLFTDGYHDQFGNATLERPDGKKLKKSKLKDLIIAQSAKPIETFEEDMKKAILDWQGDLEQIDDICLMAIEF